MWNHRLGFDAQQSIFEGAEECICCLTKQPAVKLEAVCGLLSWLTLHVVLRILWPGTILLGVKNFSAYN